MYDYDFRDLIAFEERSYYVRGSGRIELDHVGMHVFCNVGIPIESRRRVEQVG